MVLKFGIRYWGPFAGIFTKNLVFVRNPLFSSVRITAMNFLFQDDSQQQFAVLEQQQSPLPPRAPRMIPAAQPTPEVTESAPKAQFRLHAPHSIQASRSMIETFPLLSAKTLWGQTSVQRPQPVHLRSSRRRVTTFFKYLKLLFIMSSKHRICAVPYRI